MIFGKTLKNMKRDFERVVMGTTKSNIILSNIFDPFEHFDVTHRT